MMDKDVRVEVVALEGVGGVADQGFSYRKEGISRLLELDALRVLAATSVVIYHLAYGANVDSGWFSQIAKYGYLGVDLFFMISGFVILWSAQGRSLREFAISRFCKLYPVFWVCIGFTLIALYIFGEAIPDFSVVIANMTMVAGYLDQPYVDEVYWTLQVELKFYALVAVLIVLRAMRHIESVLVAWLAVCVLDFFLEIPGVLRALTIQPYGPLFIAGAAFYLIRSQGLTRLRISIIFLCLVLSIPAAYAQSASYLFGQPSIVSPIILVALFCAMGFVAAGWLNIQGAVVIQSISAITYPLYLVHNQIGRQLIDDFSLPFAIAGVFVLAFLASRIDAPISRWLRSRLSIIFRCAQNKKPRTVLSSARLH